MKGRLIIIRQIGIGVIFSKVIVPRDPFDWKSL